MTKVLVETFEVEEAIKSLPEETEEFVRQCDALGLEGQKSLVQGQGDEATVVPFRRAKVEELAVYGILCPEKTSVEEYRAEAIPLRVLQVLAHAKTLDFFQKFEVWSATTQIKDPVLVGVEKTGDHSYARYLLARWGEELDEFVVLAKKAASVWREKVKAQFATERAKLDAAELSAQTVDPLRSERPPTPTFYFH